jgi:hypothetical protein
VFRAEHKRITLESLGPKSFKETSDPNVLTAIRIRFRTAHFPPSLTVGVLLGKVIAIGE